MNTLETAPQTVGRATPPRLADMVQAQLMRLIDRGEFPRDCKLPTEGVLSTRFGVSRPVLREALQALKNAGVLHSKRGSGTVVVRGTAPGEPLFPDVRTMADLLRLYEFRIVLEGAGAALAAERHTPETLAGIAQALRLAEEVARGETPALLIDINFAFHRAVARATLNPYHLATLQILPNFVGLGRVITSSFGDESLQARAARTGEEHWRIYEAIGVRNAARARAEMESHIAAARDHVMARQALA